MFPRTCPGLKAMNGWKRVMVLSAHTGDGEFGCGGTVARLVEDGAEVHYVGFSTSKAVDVRESLSVLGIPPENLEIYDFENGFSARGVVGGLSDWKPNVVLLPIHTEGGRDEEPVLIQALRAFKHTTVLGYEVPRNRFSFSVRAYWGLEHRHLERKVRALSVYDEHGHEFASPDYVRAVATARGGNAGCAYAEVFEVYRLVL